MSVVTPLLNQSQLNNSEPAFVKDVVPGMNTTVTTVSPGVKAVNVIESAPGVPNPSFSSVVVATYTDTSELFFSSFNNKDANNPFFSNLVTTQSMAVTPDVGVTSASILPTEISLNAESPTALLFKTTTTVNCNVVYQSVLGYNPVESRFVTGLVDLTRPTPQIGNLIIDASNNIVSISNPQGTSSGQSWYENGDVQLLCTRLFVNTEERVIPGVVSQFEFDNIGTFSYLSPVLNPGGAGAVTQFFSTPLQVTPGVEYRISWSDSILYKGADLSNRNVADCFVYHLVGSDNTFVPLDTVSMYNTCFPVACNANLLAEQGYSRTHTYNIIPTTTELNIEVQNYALYASTLFTPNTGQGFRIQAIAQPQVVALARGVGR